MTELLLAYAYLLEVDLIPLDRFARLLDALFEQNPDDALFLELEWASSDKTQTINIIRWHQQKHPVETSAFGRSLLQVLEAEYKRFGPDIQGFGNKAYALWNMLPLDIQYNKPFETMMYADDPLSWGDEEKTRQLYEAMFQFYDQCAPYKEENHD